MYMRYIVPFLTHLPPKQYEWSIGTLVDPNSKEQLAPHLGINLDDIVPFMTVPSGAFCRPCLEAKPCEIVACLANCSSNKIGKKYYI